MRRLGYPVFIALIAIMPALFGCGKKEEPPAAVKVVKDEVRLKPFSITTLDGRSLSTDDLRGSPVVINFWASWCGPCRFEAETLEKSYKTFKPQGVKFVGVAIQDRERDAREFVKEYAITYPNGLDAADKIGYDYNVLGVPVTIIADHEGRVSYTHMGVITEEIMAREIKKVL